jgi:hypothetical protein
MRVCLLIVALVAVGCGSSPSGGDMSMAASDLAMSSSGSDMFSVCGHPGDTGNSKGVGKYCTDPGGSMCPAGTVCSTLMQPPQGTTYFCTIPCNINDTTNVCGENATCTCLSGNACGCVPDDCRIRIFG